MERGSGRAKGGGLNQCISLIQKSSEGNREEYKIKKKLGVNTKEKRMETEEKVLAVIFIENK